MLTGSLNQHEDIIRYLINIAKEYRGINKEYYSKESDIIISTVLLNQISNSEVILGLHDSSTNYPIQSGMIILRQVLEANITTKYICLDLHVRSKEFLLFQKELKYSLLKSIIERHEKTEYQGWKEFLSKIIENDIKESELKIIQNEIDSNKKTIQKWSNTSLKKMAIETHYIDDYEITYKELCSYSHIDARLSSYFLSRILHEDDSIYKAKIYCNLARFLWDFLLLISKYSNIIEDDVNKCWDILKK